jgi:hypothetical protein
MGGINRRFVLISFVLSAFFVVFTGTAVSAHDYPIELNYNFNGMVHPNEAGKPDELNGFRSISDRALIVDGSTGFFGGSSGDFTSAAGFFYKIVDQAFVLDIVHIGNRNTVDGGTWEFDSAADEDEIGTQPSWLVDVNQPATYTAISPPITLDTNSSVGVLYNISNGGTTYDVTLHFSDSSSITVTLHGPDWFYAYPPDAPGPGVFSQQLIPDSFPATQDVDMANPGNNLYVTEAVITAGKLLAERGFNVSGRRLTGITVGNKSETRAGVAIYAITVQGIIEGQNPQAIPTLSEWGMIIMSLMLGGSAIWFIRRRQVI